MRINVRIMAFLHDMLVMAQTLNSGRKGDIDFPITKFRFCDNFKKLHLTLVKEIEFWGLVINSVNMMLALPLEKVLDILTKYHNYEIN